nr:hypothetical protein Cry52Nrm3_p160 [Cryptomonas curvata]
MKLIRQIKKTNIYINKEKERKKHISLEFNISKKFINKLYKDILWKKKIFSSILSDLVAKNLSYIKKMQITSSMNHRLENTKNTTLMISFFLFFFKMGMLNMIPIFLRYNSNYGKFYEFIFIFISSYEWECYTSLKSSFFSLTNGFSFERNVKVLPKEYIRILILFLKKIGFCYDKDNNRKGYFNEYKNIKKITNQVVLNLLSNFHNWYPDQNYLALFFHILIKEIWNINKMSIITKFLEKIIKIKNIKKRRLFSYLFQYIISQMFICNLSLFQFLNEAKSILKCLNCKSFFINKNNIENKYFPWKKIKTDKISKIYLKNGIEIDIIKEYFVY